LIVTGVVLVSYLMTCGAVCSPTNWIETFDNVLGSTDSFFTNVGCNNSLAVSQTGGILHLQLYTAPTCLGGSIIKSKDAYASGSATARVRLGGQGAGFTGVVYTFITQSDPSTDPVPDEIDYEALGRPEYAGIIQTNWYHDGSPLGVDAKNESVTGIDAQQWFNLSISWSSTLVSWGINGNTIRSVANIGMTKPQYMWSSIWDGSLQVDWSGVIDWSASNTETSNFWIELDSIEFTQNDVDAIGTACDPVAGSPTTAPTTTSTPSTTTDPGAPVTTSPSGSSSSSSPSAGGSSSTSPSAGGSSADASNSTSSNNGTKGVVVMIWTVFVMIMCGTWAIM